MKIDLSNTLKALSKERQDESTKLNASRMVSESIAEEKERKISCLKVNNKETEISNEVVNKQILQQRDESTELYVKLKKENDTGNKVQILSKVDQDEKKRLNELREISEKMIINKNYKLICNSQSRLCLKDYIKPVTKSKERLKKNGIKQIDETNNLNVKLNNENESSMKQKIASNENQDDITRLDEIGKLLENRAGKKKGTRSCLDEVFTTIETSNEDFTKQLLEKRDENYKISVNLKTAIDSDNKIKILYNENQDEITRVNESETRLKGIEEEEERMISSFKEDIKGGETSKEDSGK